MRFVLIRTIIFLAFFSPMDTTRAQEEVTPGLRFTIYRDTNSLTILIEGQGRVRFSDLAFNVIRDGETTERSYLSRFHILDYALWETPLCLRLYIDAAASRPPEACSQLPDEQRHFEQINVVDAFWVDREVIEYYLLQLYQGDTFIDECLPDQAEDETCSAIIMPPQIGFDMTLMVGQSYLLLFLHDQGSVSLDSLEFQSSSDSTQMISLGTVLNGVDLRQVRTPLCFLLSIEPVSLASIELPEACRTTQYDAVIEQTLDPIGAAIFGFADGLADTSSFVLRYNEEEFPVNPQQAGDIFEFSR